MESLLSGYGDGDGYGYGYGGAGDGYGDGYGSGAGDGAGDYGAGYGYGEVVATIGGYKATWIDDVFGILAIGCQVRSITDWKANWRSIAKTNGVEISKEDVHNLLKSIDRV